MESISIQALFDLTKTIAHDYLERLHYPWEALDGIGDMIREIGATLPESAYTRVGEDVWIAKTASVAPSAYIGGPCIIDADAEVRHCAFIRGSAIVGRGAVVGNSTELKNCILFDGVQVPHYNYVGDSILGHRAHLGAGAITSNVKGDRTAVAIKADQPIETGRRKLGAMVGDFAEVGCHAVLNPGSVIGRRAQVYPLTSVRGIVPADHICKKADTIVLRQKR